MAAALALTRGFVVWVWGAAPASGARLMRRAPRMAEPKSGRMDLVHARAGPLAAIVAELEGTAEIMFAELPKGFLKFILGGGRRAELIGHDRRLDLLQLLFFQEFHDVLGRFRRNSLLESHDPPDRIVGRALDRPGCQVLGRHAAPNHACLQDLPQRRHLELVVGRQDDRVLLRIELDGRARPLEVVALGELLARLADGVVDLLAIDGGRDVEGRSLRHQATASRRCRNARPTLSEASTIAPTRRPPGSRCSATAARPAEAMQPHCEQSGFPPNWHGVIRCSKSAETQVVVCDTTQSAGAS